MNFDQDYSSSDIAIIGMNGRFPGAGDIEQFWHNLSQSREGIRPISNDELLRHGADPHAIAESNYVKAVADLNGIEFFDNGFFGFTPRDAEIMDPQLRLLLECAWSTIENAGYDPEDYSGSIGVFAGSAPNSYFIENLLPNKKLMQSLEGALSILEIFTASDALSTMVSFKLNLRGPSISIGTACSTSLVAVHLACQSLLSHDSDMALAGGVNINVPQERGYLHQTGMILSPDGHCRPFDADASGTLFGSGVGLVLLKRMTDAIADGDYIHAVIKGSAVNNDGSTKAGFTAPSVVGQSAAIADAIALSGISADSIDYVEAHGTGTFLGDPIEVEALARAFRESTQRNAYCGIGSVKSNIGHLDRASGIVSLIKSVLALEHGQIPATLHFRQPNPAIDFDKTPFFVVDKLTEWKTGSEPRRALVNSVGFGGTNACAVLEEPPPARSSAASRPYQLLSLSARTDAALEETTKNLAAHLEQHPDVNLADVAYTMHVGRHSFDNRRIVVCKDVTEAVSRLSSPGEKFVFSGERSATAPSIVFMFPGQGAQYPGMGAELYRNEPVFQSEVDRCIQTLQPILESDLRETLFPAAEFREEAGQQLMQTRLTQPALFVIEYALAKLWMSWGIQPAAMIGHSVGEYVAACLAGVFTLEDALNLVAERAALVQAQPSGSMLSVRLSEEDLLPLLGSDLAIAAVNSPGLCVVSGPHGEIDTLQEQLEAKGILVRRLRTSHAFHSSMMEPIMAPFIENLRHISFSDPVIPFVSNVTADWITTEQATSPEYWASHLRQTVRFTDGLTTLFKDATRLFLEAGPGDALSQMVYQHPGKQAGTAVLTSLGASRDPAKETEAILESMGKAWLTGVEIDWQGFYSNEERFRIPLPSYPFEKVKHWVEPPRAAPASERMMEQTSTIADSGRAVPESSIGVRPDAGAQIGDSPAPEEPVRIVQITETLRGILEELSGSNLSDLTESASFLEMGFDSLFLAQFSHRLESVFGVSVDFGQLATELDTVPALSSYLNSELPPDANFGMQSVSQTSKLAGEEMQQSSFEQILERIQLILEKTSGISGSDLAISTPFLEMGFDSLFLAEFSSKLEAEFGVPVQFEELFDASPDDLARSLEAKLAPGTLTE